MDGTVEDNTAPAITVYVETTSDNGIYLQKGKAVTLQKISSVLDCNYYGNEIVAVYRNYGKHGQFSVKVKDGTFTPRIKPYNLRRAIKIRTYFQSPIPLSR